MKKIYANRPVHFVPELNRQTDWKFGYFSFGRLERGPLPRRFFNATVLNHQGADWLFARLAEDVPEHRFGRNSIWVFKLDEKHVPVHGRKIDFPAQNEAQHYEDPRITRFSDGRICLSYTTFVIEVSHEEEGTTSWYGAHQAIAFLDDDFNVVEIVDPMYGGNGGSVFLNTKDEKGLPINQKNWNWFTHDYGVYLLYMTEPHEIVRWGADWTPEEVIRMQSKISVWEPYGHPRGGTPPIRIGDEYWSFFHSSTPWNEWNRSHPGDAKRRYHMGAYAFEAKPPFHITRITESPLLTGSSRDPWMPGLPLVVFPCGSILRDGTWFVTMGINDCASAWIEIPHEDLLKLTLPYANKEESKTNGTPAEPEEGNRDGTDNDGMADGQDERGGSREDPLDATDAGDAGNLAGHGTVTTRRRMRRRSSWQTGGLQRSVGEPDPAGGTVHGNAGP